MGHKNERKVWCFLSILDANGEEKLKLSGRQREKEYKAALRWCLVRGTTNFPETRNSLSPEKISNFQIFTLPPYSCCAPPACTRSKFIITFFCIRD